jgi:hypothetical protein
MRPADLETLCQLLHINYHVRVYALADRDAVQARPIEEVWMIHLGFPAHAVTHLQECKSARVHADAVGHTLTALTKSI